MDAEALDVGEIMTGFKEIASDEEHEGGGKDVKDGEDVTRMITSADFDDVDGSDEVERKSEN